MKRIIGMVLVVFLLGILFPIRVKAQIGLEKSIHVQAQNYTKGVRFRASINLKKGEEVFFGLTIPVKDSQDLPNLFIAPTSSFFGRIEARTGKSALIFKDEAKTTLETFTEGFILRSLENQKFSLGFSVFYKDAQRLLRKNITAIQIIVIRKKDNKGIGFYPIELAEVLEQKDTLQGLLSPREAIKLTRSKITIISPERLTPDNILRETIKIFCKAWGKKDLPTKQTVKVQLFGIFLRHDGEVISFPQGRARLAIMPNQKSPNTVQFILGAEELGKLDPREYLGVKFVIQMGILTNDGKITVIHQQEIILKPYEGLPKVKNFV